MTPELTALAQTTPAPDLIRGLGGNQTSRVKPGTGCLVP
jgi:hypothetical protein